MWRLTSLAALMLMAASASALEQSTAYEALRIVGTQFNRAAMSRVISVTGVDGDPQPTKWNVVIADRNAPGGVREMQVANGRILANRTPSRTVAGAAEGATIRTSRLNLDSSGAFSVASYTADKSHTNFSLVSYTLRTNERGQPVWIVTLQDEARRPLGTIQINANKGNVTRVAGMYRGANMAHVEEDRGDVEVERRDVEVDRGGGNGRDEEITSSGNDEGEEVAEGDDGDENVVKAEIKRMFRRTKRDAQRMFERVRSSFDDFVHRG